MHGDLCQLLQDPAPAVSSLCAPERAAIFSLQQGWRRREKDALEISWPVQEWHSATAPVSWDSAILWLHPPCMGLADVSPSLVLTGPGPSLCSLTPPPVATTWLPGLAGGAGASLCPSWGAPPGSPPLSQGACLWVGERTHRGQSGAKCSPPSGPGRGEEGKRGAAPTQEATLTCLHQALRMMGRGQQWGTDRSRRAWCGW